MKSTLLALLVLSLAVPAVAIADPKAPPPAPTVQPSPPPAPPLEQIEEADALKRENIALRYQLLQSEEQALLKELIAKYHLDPQHDRLEGRTIIRAPRPAPAPASAQPPPAKK